MRVEMRMALLGAAIGFMAALTPACVKPCNADTCKTGCCDTMGKCQGGDAVAACGTGGAKCGACGEGQVCTDKACVTPMMMVVDAGPGPCMVDRDCVSDLRGPICETDGGACIPKCVNDLECSRYKNGSICDLMSGKCAPARIGTRLGQGCNNDAECQEGFDSDDLCYSSGPGCICNKGDAPAATNAQGTCRRRLQACEKCSTDDQCGSDGIIFGPPGGIGVGKCSGFMGDVSGNKYCRYQKVGQCPCGTIDDGSGYCAPQSMSCSQVGCNEDKNCPSGSVCTVNQPDAGVGSCGGICVPRCRWDFINKELVAPGCRPGEVCWVDSKNLDPNSIFYGSGRCKPPCNDDNDCKGSSNPFGGMNLTCRAEKDRSGGDTAKRCRANGVCMDNAECPEKANPDDPYLGYCDRGSFICEDNTCRTGDDPVSGQAYRDCRSPFACAVENNRKICKKQTCVEQGGAGNACSTGEYCCGEDKNSDGRPDPCPPLSEQNDVGCYRAPEPPFCSTCMSDQDCNNLPLPAWLTGTGACANGSLSPSCSPLPMKCIVGLRSMMGTELRVCAPATVNDRSAVAANTSRTKADRGCPVNYDETPLRVDRGAMGADDCAVDMDCQVGAPMGRCGPDPARRLPDGGPIKVCLCPAGSLKAQCPNDFDAGIESECLDGVPGSPSVCITSYVCQFPGNRYIQPRDGGFGCGLPAPMP